MYRSNILVDALYISINYHYYVNDNYITTYKRYNELINFIQNITFDGFNTEYLHETKENDTDITTLIGDMKL